MWERVTEEQWRAAFYAELNEMKGVKFDFVTGPGRSGHVAAVYASHYLGIPFKPHKCGVYKEGEVVLVVDTVKYTGKTLRKAQQWYAKRGLIVAVAYALDETRGHYYKMWYEI